MDKKVNFVFIDESITDEINIASLTSLVVPLDKFDDIRKDFFSILFEIMDLIYPNIDKRSRPYPPLLHAKNFLRNSNENRNIDFSCVSDDFRIYIISKIVKIVSDYDLFVVRLGYDNYQEIRAHSNEDKLYATNWFGISRTLNALFDNHILIPVMEGLDSKMAYDFSNIIWSANCLSQLDPNRTIAYKNSQNFYCSVFYTQAKYTECTQIVDIISYLLQKQDYIKYTGNSSKFNDSLIDSLKLIKSENLINKIITMQFG